MIKLKQKKPDIIIYTYPDHQPSDRVRQYLSQKMIKYKEINIRDNYDPVAKHVLKIGRLEIPVVKINNFIVMGDDIEMIEALINA